jgi:hypothetical protein
MAAADKDTIYIDIDDEITGIIDKVRGSDGKVVALVLPKRAAVFQSIVNMKLLKRAADQNKKHLVLITSEAGLLPLAGAAGVHVAKTLTSKPMIPLAPGAIDDGDETIDEENGELVDTPLDKKKPVGELAAAPAASDEVETLVLDDEDLPPEDTPKAAGPKTFDPPKSKAKKNKKLSVPNFERFRLLLILGVLLLIMLIGGFVFANASMAKAEINVKTDATTVDVAVDLNLSTAAKTVSEDNNTLPAKLETQQKTFTQQVPTTGQKNNGNKASGTVRLTNCSKQDGEITIPAGSNITSGGNTFITQEEVTVNESNFSGGGTRCTSSPSASVDILAQSPGTSYNNAAGFTVGSPYNGITGTGSTSGGTDEIVKIVNQNDINSAKSKITATNDDSMKEALKSALQKNQYYAIEETYAAGAPSSATSANVGAVADTVTVTETITYTMFGAREDDIDALLEENIKTQIDTEKQSILDNGLGKAVFNVGTISATDAQINLATKATAGPDISEDTIKELAAGKKAGEVKDELKSNPDVVDVTIKVSPFWKSSIPKDVNKITVKIAEPDQNAKASTDSGDNP